MYQNIELKTSDNHKLRAKLFTTKDPKGAVIMTSAMAVPAKIYEKFAAFLAENEYSTIIFDYRGVGSNNQNNLDASIEDWATKDIPAVIEYLKQVHSNVHYIGHSIGGQMLGLVPNISDIKKVCFVACSSGTWWTDKPLKATLLAGFVMNLYVPLSNRIFGYTNSEAIKMGVNIPKAASSEWARWCRSKNFIMDHKEKYPTYKHDQMQLPALNVLIADDDIATLKSNHKLKEIYPNMAYTDYVASSEHPIGHLGLFREKNAIHWEEILKWLKG